jgi:hypothetical protein
MDINKKNRFKSDFKKEINKFTDNLEKYVSTDNGDWSVKGFIDVYEYLHYFFRHKNCF